MSELPRHGARRVAVVALVLATLVAACGSGRTVMLAGLDDTAAGTGPVTPTEPGTGGTGTTGTTGATGATGDGTVPATAPVTTTTAPLDQFPDCPTGALDAALDGGGPVDVTFWHGLNVDNQDNLDKLVGRYNAGQGRVHVNVQNQGGYLETIDKYFQSSGSSRPGLVMFPEYGMQQAIDSGAVLPVGACIAASGYDVSPLHPAILAAYATAGVQWGMPFNTSSPVLFYNRKMFEAAGLDPDRPPQSLDELRAMSQQLVDSGAAAYGVALDSGIDSGGGWFLEQWIANAGELYADNGNGRLGPAQHVLFDGPVGVELLTFVQDLVRDGLAYYVGDNAGGSAQFLKLADPNEPAAMTIGTSAGLGTVLSTLGQGLIPGLTAGDVGVGPLPGPSGTPSAIVGGAALYVTAGESPEEIAAVWDFVTYLISAEVQSEWAVDTGYLPIRADALDLEPAATTYAEDPRFRVAFDQVTGSPDDLATAGPLLGPHRQIRSETANAVAAIMGGADVATVLADAATRADALLAAYAANN